MDIQDETEGDRQYLGIYGTMGDAQDVDHPFFVAPWGSACAVCGLARSYRRHIPQPRRDATHALHD